MEEPELPLLDYGEWEEEEEQREEERRVVETHTSKKAVEGVQSLLDLCIACIGGNSEGIESLEGVPWSLRERLFAWALRNRCLTNNMVEVVLGNGLQSGQLTRLDFSRMDYIPRPLLTLIFQHDALPKISHLDLTGCDRLGGAVAVRLLERLPALTRLTLNECRAMGDEVLEAVWTRCPLLEEVSFSGMERVSGRAWASALAHPARMPNLAAVSLSFCPDLDPVTAAQMVGVHGARLRSLALGGCVATDALVHAIAEHARGLTALDLSYSDLRVGGLQALAHALPRLVRLSVAGCPRAMPLASSWAGNACFKSVEALHASDLAESHVATLATLFPSLVTLDAASCDPPLDAAARGAFHAIPSLARVSLLPHVTDMRRGGTSEDARVH